MLKTLKLYLSCACVRVLPTGVDQLKQMLQHEGSMLHKHCQTPTCRSRCFNM